MLSKCANPQCTAPFHYLHEGKVFEVLSRRSADPQDGTAKKKPASVEHFWLCSSCAKTMTLAVDRERRVSLIPLTRTARSAAAS